MICSKTCGNIWTSGKLIRCLDLRSVMTVTSVAALVPVVPTTVAAVVITVLVPFAFLPALSLHFAFALMILIVTLIFRIVFPRSHEVHRPITGVVTCRARF